MKPEEVIISPIKTEKAQQILEQNHYLFKVHPKANKIQIKEAIEKIFKTKVEKVRVVKVKPKERIFRGKRGKKSGYKKAIVVLKKGEKIEIK